VAGHSFFLHSRDVMMRNAQIRKQLDAIADALREAGIEEAEMEAEFLLRHLLDCDRAQLFMLATEKLSEAQLAQLQAMVARRLSREPLAYILGEWDFLGRTFLVNRSVLIPRPETEQLVDSICNLVGTGKFNRLLDVGCGSGAIAISLALEEITGEVVAMDISSEALEVAAENARRLGASERVDFVRGDLRRLPFSCSFDLVVANLPYIASAEIEHLMPEVSRFEPRSALDGGISGTSLLQSLAEGLGDVLSQGGWVALEIGADQEDFVVELFTRLQYDRVAVLKDYAGLPRILQARRR